MCALSAHPSKNHISLKTGGLHVVVAPSGKDMSEKWKFHRAVLQQSANLLILGVQVSVLKQEVPG